MDPQVRRLSFWYIVFPLSALIVVWPMVRALPPISWHDNLNTLQSVAALPFWLGVVAAPGYLYAWNGHHAAPLLSPTRMWVALSLGTSLVASLLGTIMSALAVVPIPFTVGSAICCLLLIRQFRRSSA
jgi:hypothetical protein